MVNQGVLQMSVPFVIYFINFNPKQRKNVMWLGCLICVLAPIGGAFSRTVSRNGLWRCVSTEDL